MYLEHKIRVSEAFMLGLSLLSPVPVLATTKLKVRDNSSEAE